MMGSFVDPDSELTNEINGHVCNFGAFDTMVAPSYNPLVFQAEKERVDCFITAIDDKPCVYMESVWNDDLYQTWVDIEHGVVIKELVFDSEGLLIEKKIATSIAEKDIPDTVFDEPKDIAYNDMTMLVFAMEGGNTQDLYEAISSSLPEAKTGIKLVSDRNAYTLHTTGMQEGMMGDIMLDDVIYVSKHTNSDGEVARIRELKDDRYYTVHDGLQKVEIYDESCFENKFFDFTNVGLLSVEENKDSISYAFYNPNNISVSALYPVYEYVIQDGKIAKINTYEIESVNDNTPVRDKLTYEIEMIDFDESVYDDSCMDTYEIIDHGEGSFNDGEHMPFWYE